MMGRLALRAHAVELIANDREARGRDASRLRQWQYSRTNAADYVSWLLRREVLAAFNTVVCQQQSGSFLAPPGLRSGKPRASS